MKQSTLILVTVICAIVSVAQANGAGKDQNETEGMPSRNLRRLYNILSASKHTQDETMQLQDLVKLISPTGKTEDPAARNERGLKDFIAKLKKMFAGKKKPGKKSSKPPTKKPSKKPSKEHSKKPNRPQNKKPIKN